MPRNVFVKTYTVYPIKELLNEFVESWDWTCSKVVIKNICFLIKIQTDTDVN